MILNESFTETKILWNNLNDIMKKELMKKFNNQIDVNNLEKFFNYNSNVCPKDDDWKDILDYSDGINASDSLIELFIILNAKNWGIKLEFIEPWIDVLVSMIYQLGFTYYDNAFIAFLKIFYSKLYNKDIALSREQVILINNMWSDGDIEAEDLRGTGVNGRDKHIIFNPYLWRETNVEVIKNIIIAYQKLSEPNYVKDLNIYAIDNMKGSPYNGTLRCFSAKGTRGSGQSKNEKDLNSIRNIIIFKNPESPQTSQLQPFLWIKRALITGENNHYSGANNDDYINRKSAKRIAFDALNDLNKDDILAVINALKKTGRLQ